MKKADALIVLLCGTSIGIILTAKLIDLVLPKFTEQDRQAMAGEWSIAIQVPPCDKGQVGINYPEREGDVLTVYCKTMPVKAK